MVDIRYVLPNIKELEKKGLRILARNVEDQSPDAFISDLVNEIKITKAKLLVIDSLSSFEHQYKDKLYLITKALGSLVRQQEVTAIFTILTTQQSGFTLSDLGVSSLFQNIFILRCRVQESMSPKRASIRVTFD